MRDPRAFLKAGQAQAPRNGHGRIGPDLDGRALTYIFKPPAARKLRIPKNQSLGSLLTSGLRCRLITAAKATTLRATLRLGNTVVGQIKVKKKKAGRTSLTVPLNAAGRARLSGARNARLRLTVKAQSRNTTRAKLRVKRALGR